MRFMIKYSEQLSIPTFDSHNRRYHMNKKEVIEWTKAIGFSLGFATLLILFARPTVVYGNSMNETLKNMDILLTNQVQYRVKDFERGDIIVFKSIENTNYIKRIVGVAGDTVKIVDGKVYINGLMLEEDYISEVDYTSEDLEVFIPEGKVFVLGDNRNNSTDSRHWTVGLVDEFVILGKSYVRLYPFNKVGSI